jgi:hypothetical protein
VVVALVDSDAPIAPEIEQSALAFLSGGSMATWAERAVGGS